MNSIAADQLKNEMRVLRGVIVKFEKESSNKEHQEYLETALQKIYNILSIFDSRLLAVESALSIVNIKTRTLLDALVISINNSDMFRA